MIALMKGDIHTQWLLQQRMIYICLRWMENVENVQCNPFLTGVTTHVELAMNLFMANAVEKINQCTPW